MDDDDDMMMMMMMMILTCVSLERGLVQGRPTGLIGCVWAAAHPHQYFYHLGVVRVLRPCGLRAPHLLGLFRVAVRGTPMQRRVAPLVTDGGHGHLGR